SMRKYGLPTTGTKWAGSTSGGEGVAAAFESAASTLASAMAGAHRGRFAFMGETSSSPPRLSTDHRSERATQHVPSMPFTTRGGSDVAITFVGEATSVARGSRRRIEDTRRRVDDRPVLPRGHPGPHDPPARARPSPLTLTQPTLPRLDPRPPI